MAGILAPPRPRPNPRRGGILSPPSVHSFYQDPALYPDQPAAAVPPALDMPPETTAAVGSEASPIMLDEITVLGGPDDVTIPGGSASPAQAPEGEPYEVKRGDTLWRIAQERYGNGQFWEAIAAANGITDPRQLMPGQVLMIPDVQSMGRDAMAPEGPMGMARGEPRMPPPRRRPDVPVA